MSTETENAVIVEKQGGVGIITLNRPGKINAANTEIRKGLPEILTQLEVADDISAILIHGAGDRGFCAGADIKERRANASAADQRARLIPVSWIESLDSVTKPVIAVIHGVCMGAGLELAMACDIRLAVRGSRFALPETGLGLIPGGGGTQRLPRICGLGCALEMILAGDEWDAGNARNAGLISRIYESKDEAMTGGIDLCGRIAQRSKLANAYAKEAVRASVETTLPSGLALEKSLFAILADSIKSEGNN